MAISTEIRILLSIVNLLNKHMTTGHVVSPGGALPPSVLTWGACFMGNYFYCNYTNVVVVITKVIFAGHATIIL